MPTTAFVPVRLRQRGLVPLIAFGVLLPIACSDRATREDLVLPAGTGAEARVPSIAPECPRPRTSGWVLVQLRSYARLPAACHFSDGSPDALATAFASLEPDPWRDPPQPREFAFVVPSALPLHGIDLAVLTCEVQLDLGVVSYVDVMVVRDPQQLAHGQGGRRSSSLQVTRPQP